jgi:hypothetical protein
LHQLKGADWQVLNSNLLARAICAGARGAIPERLINADVTRQCSPADIIFIEGSKQHDRNTMPG